MTSPQSRHIPLSRSFPRGSFLLEADESSYPLSSRGHAGLASLIQSSRRASTPAHHPTARDEEDVPSEWTNLKLSQPLENAPLVSDERRMEATLNMRHLRSMRLIGKNKSQYRWERYWKTLKELKTMRKPIRQYYERTNYLIQQYLYIDKLLDSSLPHDLLNEYNHMPRSAFRGVEIPDTICEESECGSPPKGSKVKRTPKHLYRPSTETSPLLHDQDSASSSYISPSYLSPSSSDGDSSKADESALKQLIIPGIEDENVDSNARVVIVAIYINFAANAFLLAAKIAVVLNVPSVSVMASLVDAALDFLSTFIVWITAWLISKQDQYRYPVGRRRLEPIGVLVFSVIMITSFVQVALEALERLASGDRHVIQLTYAALATMLSTIIIKGFCWLWCRMVKNSSVQALASDASTDVIFNAGSIAFPIVGYYAQIWWLDALGGLVLALVVIFNWSQTSIEHIGNLAGYSATSDQRNVLLYLTMRFAKSIKQIQGLQAYHAGDKLNVEVDIVLDASTSLRDSHDLSESLQYVIESVPIVDRAFVHVDYATYNLPTHMEQQTD